MQLISRASHLFHETGKRNEVAEFATTWLIKHLGSPLQHEKEAASCWIAKEGENATNEPASERQRLSRYLDHFGR